MSRSSSTTLMLVCTLQPPKGSRPSAPTTLHGMITREIPRFFDRTLRQQITSDTPQNATKFHNQNKFHCTVRVKQNPSAPSSDAHYRVQNRKKNNFYTYITPYNTLKGESTCPLLSAVHRMAQEVVKANIIHLKIHNKSNPERLRITGTRLTKARALADWADLLFGSASWSASMVSKGPLYELCTSSSLSTSPHCSTPALLSLPRRTDDNDP